MEVWTVSYLKANRFFRRPQQRGRRRLREVWERPPVELFQAGTRAVIIHNSLTHLLDLSLASLNIEVDLLTTHL